MTNHLKPVGSDSLHVSYTPQGLRRVLVKFEGVNVRGIPHKGQAWFDITWTNVGPVLERADFHTTGSPAIYATRQDKPFHCNDASRAAMSALAPMVQAEALEWCGRNQEAFIESGRLALDATMDAAAEAVIAAEQVLDAARSAHADARIALESFNAHHAAK